MEVGIETVLKKYDARNAQLNRELMFAQAENEELHMTIVQKDKEYQKLLSDFHDYKNAVEVVPCHDCGDPADEAAG